MAHNDTWPAACLSLALAALLAGCGVVGRQAGSGAGAAPAQVVDVVIQDWRYHPAEIRVQAGQPVTLGVQNRDSVLHDLNVDRIRVTAKREEGGGHGAHGSREPDLHLAVKAGGTSRLSFTPMEKGRYEVYCAEPGHREAGMVAALVVD